MIKPWRDAALVVSAIAGSLLLSSRALAEQRDFTIPVQQRPSISAQG
jgi:hypothetical protein